MKGVHREKMKGKRRAARNTGRVDAGTRPEDGVVRTESTAVNGSEVPSNVRSRRADRGWDLGKRICGAVSEWRGMTMTGENVR